MYLDICLCRLENDEPVLAIAPAWKIREGDYAVLEGPNGDRDKASVEAVYTTNRESDEFKFIGSVFGEDPARNRVVQKYYIKDLDWSE